MFQAYGGAEARLLTSSHKTFKDTRGGVPPQEESLFKAADAHTQHTLSHSDVLIGAALEKAFEKVASKPHGAAAASRITLNGNLQSTNQSTERSSNAQPRLDGKLSSQENTFPLKRHSWWN